MTRYLDDFTVGERFEAPQGSLSEAEIVEFAEIFDPQYFHLDPEAAKASPYGGLIASGHQTIAFGFSSIVRLGIFAGDAAICGADMSEVRWLAPVRPDMPLTARGEVVEIRRSESKPDRGYLKIRFTVDGPDGTVASFHTSTLMRTCDGAAAGDRGDA
ncbi:MAG: MaoC/PaaZ C-terminal domain-containing protein [Alphaproteobacteria bacterium]|jgi:acyl dehydratase